MRENREHIYFHPCLCNACSTELQWADTQSNHIFTNLGYLKKQNRRETANEMDSSLYSTAWWDKPLNKGKSKVAFSLIDNIRLSPFNKPTLTLQRLRTNLCDPADLSFVFGAVAGSRQGAFLYWPPTVQGSVGGGADVKGIVGVVVQLVSICQALLTCCKNLSCLSKEGKTGYE